MIEFRFLFIFPSSSPLIASQPQPSSNPWLSCTLKFQAHHVILKIASLAMISRKKTGAQKSDIKPNQLHRVHSLGTSRHGLLDWLTGLDELTHSALPLRSPFSFWWNKLQAQNASQMTFDGCRRRRHRRLDWEVGTNSPVREHCLSSVWWNVRKGYRFPKTPKHSADPVRPYMGISFSQDGMLCYVTAMWNSSMTRFGWVDPESPGDRNTIDYQNIVFFFFKFIKD